MAFRTILLSRMELLFLSVLPGKRFGDFAAGVPFDKMKVSFANDATRIAVYVYPVTAYGDDIGFGAYLFVRYDGSRHKKFAILFAHTEIQFLTVQVLHTEFDGVASFEFSGDLNKLPFHLP